MGIWDAVQWTTDNLKRGAPDLTPVKDIYGSTYDLGVKIHTAVTGEAAGDLLQSAADKVRSGAPDLAPVTRICRSSYNYGSAAASMVDNAVRVEGTRRIKDCMPDQDGRERIGRIGWNLADAALGQVIRSYTGGFPVYKLVKEGWSEDPHQSRQRGKLHQVKQEELQELRNRVEMMEATIKRMEGSGSRPCFNRTLPLDMVGGAQKPEDILGVFMMKGFNGGDFLDSQVIPQAGKMKTP